MNTPSEDMTPPKAPNQFALLFKRRFAPFFWTQFSGAFNDNIFKNVLLLMIAFQSGQMISNQSDILINLAAGLFILPFFLFSALAGQIADKYEKSKLIRMVKIAEIIIMLLAAVALYYEWIFALLALLFFMGAQSTFFGPVKYSIMPQHLEEEELVGGNALVEMGTFVAILLGTLFGGILVGLDRHWTAAAVIGTSVAGWFVSRKIPAAAPASPELQIRWNLFRQSVEILGYARRERVVFLSVLGISWFWFMGACYLTQIPNFTRNVLYGSEQVATLLLTMFSLGIGTGSLLCEWLSGKKVEYGLVPIGSIGLSLFGLDLAFAYKGVNPGHLMGVFEFIKTPGSLRVLVDLVLIGVFGGFYIVPLVALVQTRSDKRYLSRIIAANNIINAFLMVLAALSGAFLLGWAGLDIPHFFLVIVLMNVAVALFIYTLVPEFTMRCLIWVLTHLVYRIRHKNLYRIPQEGPAVIVCNHVSYVDALVIASLCRRPARFVMAKSIYKIPILNFIFRTGKTIPIASEKSDPHTYANAFESIASELNAGHIVCIFPEGHLTQDGEIDVFRPGIEKILARNPVPVVPSALIGLWGSFFSHKGGPAALKFPKRFFSRIDYHVGEVIPAENASAEYLRQVVSELRGAGK